MSTLSSAELLSEVDRLLEDSFELTDTGTASFAGGASASAGAAASLDDVDFSEYFGSDAGSTFDFGSGGMNTAEPSIDAHAAVTSAPTSYQPAVATAAVTAAAADQVAESHEFNYFDSQSSGDDLFGIGNDNRPPHNHHQPYQQHDQYQPAAPATSAPLPPNSTPDRSAMTVNAAPARAAQLSMRELTSPPPVYLMSSPTDPDSDNQNQRAKSYSSTASANFSASLQQLQHQQQVAASSPAATHHSPSGMSSSFNAHALLSPSAINEVKPDSPRQVVANAVNGESANANLSVSTSDDTDPFSSYFGSSELHDPFAITPSPATGSHGVHASFAQPLPHEQLSQPEAQQPFHGQIPSQPQLQVGQPLAVHRSKTQPQPQQHEIQQHGAGRDSFMNYFDESTSEPAFEPVEQQQVQPRHQQPQQQAQHATSNYDYRPHPQPVPQPPLQSQSHHYQSNHAQFPSSSFDAMNGSQELASTVDEFDSTTVPPITATDFLSYQSHLQLSMPASAPSIVQARAPSPLPQIALTSMARTSSGRPLPSSLQRQQSEEMAAVELDNAAQPLRAQSPPASSGGGYDASASFYQPPLAPQSAPLTETDDSSISRSFTRPPPHPIVSFGFGGKMILTFPILVRPFAATIRQISGGSQSMSDEYEINASNGSSHASNRGLEPQITSVRPGSIRLLTLSSIAAASPVTANFLSFPGPLSKLKSKDTEKLRAFVARQCQQSLTFSLTADQVHRQCYRRLLWRALDVLVQKRDNESVDSQRAFVELLTSHESTTDSSSGNDSGSGPMWLQSAPAADAHANQSSPGLQSLTAKSSSLSTTSHSSTVADKLQYYEKHLAQQRALVSFPSLLLSGDRRSVIEMAIEHQLYDFALVLARDDDAVYKRVVLTLCQQSLMTGVNSDAMSLIKTQMLVSLGLESKLWEPLLPPSSSIDTVYQSFVTPKSIDAANLPPLIASWRSHLAICLANRNANSAAFALHLGDYLWSHHDQSQAAHLCYLMSGSFQSLVSAIPTPSTRVTLVGADHRRHLRLVDNESHILASEIYEYSQSSSISDLLVYKLILAVRYSDFGANDTALRYCEELGAAVKALTRKDGTTSASVNPLFVYHFTIFDHRLRVLLNAPSTAPVSAKLVNGLFSVLDKGINLLVGESTAPVSNSTGEGQTRSQWGESGMMWERKFLPIKPSPVLAATGADQSLRAMSLSPGLPPTSITPTQSSVVSNGLAPPTAALGSLRLSRSGDSIASMHANNPATAGKSVETPFYQPPPRHEQQHAIQSPSPAIQQAAQPQPPFISAQTPYQPAPHPMIAPQLHQRSMQQPANVQSQPFHQPAPPQQQHSDDGISQPSIAAASNGAASAANANAAAGAGGGAGLMKRLGSVGGLFKMWGGATQAKPNTKEANLDEDHSFTWDEVQQKYVFRDKEGKEVSESDESQQPKPGPPPPAVTDEMKRRWTQAAGGESALPAQPAASASPLPPCVASSSSPGLPPPMPMPGANLFAKRGMNVTSRYALSVGSEFMAPAAPIAAAPTLTPLMPAFGSEFVAGVSPSAAHAQPVTFQPQPFYAPGSTPAPVPAHALPSAGGHTATATPPRPVLFQPPVMRPGAAPMSMPQTAATSPFAPSSAHLAPMPPSNGVHPPIPMTGAFASPNQPPPMPMQSHGQSHPLKQHPQQPAQHHPRYGAPPQY